MSFKKFSSAQGASTEENPDDKSTDVPAADQPATQPDEKPAEDAPAPKS